MNHACRGTCNGWDDGFEEGCKEIEKTKLLVLNQTVKRLDIELTQAKCDLFNLRTRLDDIHRASNPEGR